MSTKKQSFSRKNVVSANQIVLMWSFSAFVFFDSSRSPFPRLFSLSFLGLLLLLSAAALNFSLRLEWRAQNRFLLQCQGKTSIFDLCILLLHSRALDLSPPLDVAGAKYLMRLRLIFECTVCDCVWNRNNKIKCICQFWHLWSRGI